MSSSIFSSTLLTFPPSASSTPSPPPPRSPSFFGLPPVFELLGIVFIFLLGMLYFCLLKLICSKITHEFYDGELPETVEIQASDFIYGGDDDGETECVICLCEIEEGEKCRKMSTCGHVFHRDCIDRWLKVDRHCPLCRSCVCVVVQS